MMETERAHSLPATPARATPGSLAAWLLATRPATLSAAAAPVLVGTAVSAHYAPTRAPIFVATLLGAFLLQIASNFANDVFDYEKGADTHERLGPTRAVQAGLLSGPAMKRGLAVVIGCALLVGSYLVFHAGWPIVAIGIASIVCAVAYTAGPYPLGYHGLGDVFVMIFFGFVAVCGTSYAQLLRVPLLAYPAAFALGAVTTNILVVNNLRDRHTDRKVGKRTLAVRWGRRGATAQYALLYAGSYLAPLAMIAFGATGYWVLLSWLTAPLAYRNFQKLRTHEGAALNGVLVATARLVFLYGVSLAAGLWLHTYVGS